MAKGYINFTISLVTPYVQRRVKLIEKTETKKKKTLQKQKIKEQEFVKS